MGKKDRKDEVPGTVFKVGGIAFAFLIIGYQSALFVHRAAALYIAAHRDAPDTVYVVDEALAARLLEGAAEAGGQRESDAPPGQSITEGKAAGNRTSGNRFNGQSGGATGTAVTVRRNAAHAPAVERERQRTQRVESFTFNPNTVSVEDLMRLGFSEKQAQSIDNYRAKGGRFRRPSDFAKSYVVADSVYERLKPFIIIPKLDINKADSAAFDALPGIGPYFASKMVSYRERLGGYSFKEQLMDIYHFDQEKYDALSDLIVCSPPQRAFRLWQAPQDSLRQHPYIRSWQTARSIALFRNSMPRSDWTVEALGAAGILAPEDASRLARCAIAPP